MRNDINFFFCWRVVFYPGHVFIFSQINSSCAARLRRGVRWLDWTRRSLRLYRRPQSSRSGESSRKGMRSCQIRSLTPQPRCSGISAALQHATGNARALPVKFEIYQTWIVYIKARIRAEWNRQTSSYPSCFKPVWLSLVYWLNLDPDRKLVGIHFHKWIDRLWLHIYP